MDPLGLNKFISPNQEPAFSKPVGCRFLSLALFISIAALGCATKQMTLDEAMQASISLRGRSFVPPPRGIADILDLIAREHRDDSIITREWADRLKAEIPAHATRKELIQHYYKKAQAASHLHYFEQSRENLQKAYDLSGPGKFNDRIINLWAGCELNLQNYERAVGLSEILKETGRMGIKPYDKLVYIYALTGHFDRAQSLRSEAMIHFGHRKLTPYDEFLKARIEYNVLNMTARYAQAEPIMRQAVVMASSIRPPIPDMVQVERIRLVRNLIEQSRLVDAELEARIALDHSFKSFGAQSVQIMAAKTILAEVLLAQGRVTDAEKINRSAVQAYKTSSVPATYGWWSRSKETMGKILVAKGEYAAAMREYEFFGGMKKTNRYLYDAFYSNDKNVMLALTLTGRPAEAMGLIKGAYQRSETLLGRGHPQNAELLALRGMANHGLNDLESAYRDFSDSIHAMATSKTYAENRLSSHRFMLIVESYLSLLSKLRGSAIEKQHSFSASAKAFEASMLLGGGGVQAAVLASTARMSIADPDLKKLARAEQDIQQQMAAYRNLLQSLLVKPADKVDHRALDKVKGLLDSLGAARGKMIAEIERRFPDYANLVNYHQPSMADIQSCLRPEEVLISISSTATSTFVFAVPPAGPAQMVWLRISSKDLEALVSGIKKSLYPDSYLLGRLPAFDFAKAYELYALLLKPVEETWKTARHLIFMTAGPSGQIPLAILPTRPFEAGAQQGVRFSSYRSAPWLIKRVSTNTVPSISSLAALRATAQAASATEAFAGFGDPLFNTSQMAGASNENKLPRARKTVQQAKLDIRGIRVTSAGNLDDKTLTTCRLESLQRLPDTADELLALAGALGADSASDVYLGKRASEKQVKTTDLSNRRVVAFASHALVPYDIDGLDQPAIALSAPAVTGEQEDGLLTMSEILDLRLNADFVVLSACNTGAADGAGAEAVSGLGRAFFYAGTRAVLVSMWPVETGSARELTTSLFRNLKDNIGIDKAQAHRMAMLELIEGPGMLDEDGRTIVSYAHPLFWAPFIIVGDH